MAVDDRDQLLAEQVAYYRARAGEYFVSDSAAEPALEAALDEFRPTGDVLELACGPGTWTPQLLRYASAVTAVDASPEMIAIASSRVGADAAAKQVASSSPTTTTGHRRS